MLHVCMVNAHILYKAERPNLTRNDDNYSLIQFIQSVCHSWRSKPIAQPTAEAKRTVQQQYSVDIRRTPNHVPVIRTTAANNNGVRTNVRGVCLRSTCTTGKDDSKGKHLQFCFQCNGALCMPTELTEKNVEKLCWYKWHNTDDI